jgi:hypothetical protein
VDLLFHHNLRLLLQFTQVKQGEPTEQTSSTAALLQVLPTVNEVTAEVVKVVVEEVKTLAC